MSQRFHTTSWRGYFRRLALGLPTALGASTRGFFIPYRYALEMPKARPPYGSVEDRFHHHRSDFVDLIAGIDDMAYDLQRIDREAPPQPRWDQEWFPRLDAAAAYTIVRKLTPRRILEIGAGHSTRFYARAIRDGALDTQLRSIDPQPRASLDGLDVDVIHKTVERAGDRPFADLEGGDILSIDSSHILMPGTDVDILCNRILPHLPFGVFIHFHDVFLPDGYPQDWAWRGYNEQCAIAAMLSCGEWDVVWSSHYVTTRMASVLQDTVIARLPLRPTAHEASLWLEKRHLLDFGGCEG